uniref:Uncharacterized protein n=1 Tax=Heterorhabditis bacteriophora TaxID=37862 RepID=A0A1I7X4N5_HETBA
MTEEYIPNHAACHEQAMRTQGETLVRRTQSISGDGQQTPGEGKQREWTKRRRRSVNTTDAHW